MALKPPVLFLDFDGVLHAQNEPALDENFRLLPNPRLFCWREILESELLPYPTVQIIVSSDWRRLFDDDNLVRLLGPLGPRFIGVVESYQHSRAEEIVTDASRRGLACWLAIDDHPSVCDARNNGDARFIACSPDTGLQSDKVQRELRRKLAELLRCL